MSHIRGVDNRALAELLDYRVGELESKVMENGHAATAVGIAVAKVETKIDTLIDLHKQSVERFDAHIEKGDQAQPFRLTPVWLFAGASAVIAWATAAYVAGKAHTDRFVTWFLNLIGA